MPWNMQDYPNSMKNMELLVRKKAIDIANAIEEEGYEEDQLIPIAQAQAKEWFEKAKKAGVPVADEAIKELSK